MTRSLLPKKSRRSRLGRAHGALHAVGLVGALALLPTLEGVAGAAPTLRVQVDQHGDFVMFGNTLGHECGPGTVAPIVGNVGACGQANTLGDSAPDVFWRSDSPGAGQAEANTGISIANARSRAVLAVPAGANVTHAYLYWGGIANAADNQVTLTGPGGAQAVTAGQSFVSANNSYQSVADVTAVVQAQGVGAYTVSGVDTTQLVNVNSSNNFAGWYMVVFYERAIDPLRNLALFDGLDPVSNGNNQAVTLNGFLVPNAGFDGKLGVATFEGDSTITGDSLFFGATQLSNAANPIDNFFNGSRTLLGAPVTTVGDLPQLTGGAGSMSGMDLDVVNVTALLSPGQTSANLNATSTGDVYYLAAFVTSISTFAPDFSTSTKSVVDLNGGLVLPGDILEYTIVATNTGNDTSVDTYVTDTLPPGVTYVPGTIQITQGANPGAKTDVAGDDQAEYTLATNTIEVRIGSGANAVQGGSLVVGESQTIKFQVQLNANANGTISNQAIVTGGGLLGAPPSDTPTDGNGGGAGQPPTDIPIDQCDDNSDCSAPTPFCDLSQSPTACVQCLVDADCSGLAPTCDPATKTCVCVPTGGETCDGDDNDCNGAVDDNVPGTGVACATNLPGVCAAGLSQCSGNGIACVPNITPGSLPETCGNGTDDDCDGVSEETCDDDGDGLTNEQETTIGTNPNDADSDDDGVLDGTEPSFGTDSDGDGLINALDPDSDDDGLYDGTELGLGCGNAATNVAAMHCIPDGDGGATTTDPLDPDTDNGGIPDGAEDINLNGVIDAGEGDPNDPADDDNPPVDTDGDGLTDVTEIQIGTDPNDADSDDDGVLDGLEPNFADDADGDGLINSLDPDSDNDGLFDGTELGLDCSNAATSPSAGHCVPDADGGATTTNPLDADTDDGGVPDGAEDFNLDGAIDAGEGDPNDPTDDSNLIDTDGDGLTDGVEIAIGTDPNDADSDDDGALDGDEPNYADDTDGDGTINALDPDSDGDGILDGTELGFDCGNAATNPAAGNCVPDADGGATTTSPVNPDTDFGGVPDGVEDLNHNGQIDGSETDPNDPSDDAVTDTDGDGLTDVEEIAIGTDPNDADSDDDGALDGQEAQPGQDTDGDGTINGLDPDSDGDGIFDGTELGFDCTNAATDPATGNCVPDADDGATTTNPLDTDTDDGGVPDGTEDANHNGMIDVGETDPNDPIDDQGGQGGGGNGGGGNGGAGGGGAGGQGGQPEGIFVAGNGFIDCSVPTGGSSSGALALAAVALGLVRRRKAR